MALTRISPPTATGAGWSAIRIGRIVILTVAGWDGTQIQLPWGAALQARGVLTDGQNNPFRCVAQGSTMTVYGTPTTTSLFGQITYVA